MIGEKGGPDGEVEGVTVRVLRKLTIGRESLEEVSYASPTGEGESCLSEGETGLGLLLLEFSASTDCWNYYILT